MAIYLPTCSINVLLPQSNNAENYGALRYLGRITTLAGCLHSQRNPTSSLKATATHYSFKWRDKHRYRYLLLYVYLWRQGVQIWNKLYTYQLRNERRFDCSLVQKFPVDCSEERMLLDVCKVVACSKSLIFVLFQQLWENSRREIINH